MRVRHLNAAAREEDTGKGRFWVTYRVVILIYARKRLEYLHCVLV